MGSTGASSYLGRVESENTPYTFQLTHSRNKQKVKHCCISFLAWKKNVGWFWLPNTTAEWSKGSKNAWAASPHRLRPISIMEGLPQHSKRRASLRDGGSGWEVIPFSSWWPDLESAETKMVSSSRYFHLRHTVQVQVHQVKGFEPEDYWKRGTALWNQDLSLVKS